MKAAVITRAGGPEVLEIQDRFQPQPTGEDVLVRVHASALNRADLLQREGKYPAPPRDRLRISRASNSLVKSKGLARELQCGQRVSAYLAWLVAAPRPST